MSYAGVVTGGSIIVIGGEVALCRQTTETAHKNAQYNRVGRHSSNVRVEGELYDEETERWFSLPQVQSGLGPGRTHAATTFCRVLFFAQTDGGTSERHSNSSACMPATGLMTTVVAADGPASSSKRGGATSMTETIEKVRCDCRAWRVSAGSLMPLYIRILVSTER